MPMHAVPVPGAWVDRLDEPQALAPKAFTGKHWHEEAASEPATHPMARWTEAEVFAWLVHTVGLEPKVAGVVRAASIDGATLLDLSPEDLAQCGLGVGAVRRIQKAVEAHRVTVVCAV